MLNCNGYKKQGRYNFHISKEPRAYGYDIHVRYHDDIISFLSEKLKESERDSYILTGFDNIHVAVCPAGCQLGYINSPHLSQTNDNFIVLYISNAPFIITDKAFFGNFSEETFLKHMRKLSKYFDRMIYGKKEIDIRKSYDILL